MIRFHCRMHLWALGFASLVIAYPLWAQTLPVPTPDPAAEHSTTTQPTATQPATSQPTTRRSRPRTPPQADKPAMKWNEHDRFLQMHQSFLDRATQGPVDLLFLGDSITEWWSHSPEVFDKYYGNLNAANFGIAGDQTQHVLWRIENGELDNIKPKVVVLLIGINNGQNTAEQIAAANRKILDVIHDKLPETRVLLLAVFPNGGDPTADWVPAQRARIKSLNQTLASYDDGKQVRFLDITDKFLDEKGGIPVDLMPDGLHPSAKGYEVWAEAMKPLLDEMMTP